MPTLSQIPLLAAMLGQRPVDEDVREPDSDADDVVTLEEPPKTILDPGEPTKRLRGLFDRLASAMPNLRREQKPGVPMKSPVPDNGKASSPILNESVVGRRAEIAPPQPDVGSDVVRQIAMANTRRQEAQQLVDRSQRSEDVASHLSDLVNQFGEKPDLAKPLYQDFKEAGPLLAAVLMKPGTDPGFLNGSSQKLMPRFPNPPAKTVVEEPVTPARLNARGNAKVAANPGWILDPNDPEQASLQARLLSDPNLNLVHPEAKTDEQVAAAKAAMNQKRTTQQLALDERQADNAAALKQESFKGRRYGRSVAGNGVPDSALDSAEGRTAYLADMAPRRPLGYTEADIRRGMQAASQLSRDPNAFKQPTEGELSAEFERRKQAVATKYAPEENSDVKVLPGGSQVRWDTGRPKFIGPASGGNEERAAEYLAKISGQAGLSKPVASLDEFKQQQAANRQQNMQIAEDKSKRNLAAMIMGRSGGALPKDADLKATRAFNTGRRQGPTYADMLQYQKDETAKKRAEADRDNKLRLLAQLNAANPDGKNVELKKKADMLAAEIGSGVQGDDASGLPEVTKRKSADELAAQGKPVVKPSKPLTAKSESGRMAERLIGNVQDAFNEEYNPYDSFGRYLASPLNPFSGGPLQAYTQWKELQK